ncbi:hypothetical protein J8281_12140 [Aquimarina sp. U1-2]|uniref:hypothetical protein n=1 Tax=Aquimarina sp. U1-2 TaxID=2823141 RepID=UPI001AECFE99|nr:hypothetical protein [Aquimarina sp. U1-2]MBP2832937.1 hypothetical protein [Aquimarina sp. U1-2]
MITSLRSQILLIFLFCSFIGTAQFAIAPEHISGTKENQSALTTNYTFLSTTITINKEQHQSSYPCAKSMGLHRVTHNSHEQQLSLLDVLSSDEGTDFNCSGGFCMNTLHFHKKGLTLKRQFFIYFLSISC